MIQRVWLTFALFAAATSIEAGDGRGEQVFRQYCTGCHGSDGSGAMPGVSDLTEPAGALSKADSVLLASLINGTPGSQGMAMPPRAGNAALTDDDLRATLAHLRRLTGIRPK